LALGENRDDTRFRGQFPVLGAYDLPSDDVPVAPKPGSVVSRDHTLPKVSLSTLSILERRNHVDAGSRDSECDSFDIPHGPQTPFRRS
jgi:hypothetical protein